MKTQRNIIAENVREFVKSYENEQTNDEEFFSYMLGTVLRLFDKHDARRIELVRDRWHKLREWDPTEKMLSDAEIMSELFYLGLKTAEEDIRYIEDMEERYDYSEIPF